MQTLRNLCRDDVEALDLLDKVTQGHQGERTDFVYNVNEVDRESRPAGNSRAASLRRLRKDAEYLTRRIARDNPALLERMKTNGVGHLPISRAFSSARATALLNWSNRLRILRQCFCQRPIRYLKNSESGKNSRGKSVGSGSGSSAARSIIAACSLAGSVQIKSPRPSPNLCDV